MEIKRDRYLQELIDRKHNGLIKIVTGLRRCGKSYLLMHIFYNHLIECGTPKDHIITVTLDNLKNEKYLNPHTLLAYLESKITDANQHYIILDEIQLVDNFTGLLNSLLHIENADVYVTGSNSRFLSRDVITEFRGRGDEVHLYPLRFCEYMTAYPGDKYEGWYNYRTYGGLPYILTRKTEEQKIVYLKNLFAETYLIDIINRHNIRNDAELEILLDILSSSVGSLTNPTKICNTFKSVNNTDISDHTVKKYLDALEESFLVTGVKRFDVRGRKYIGSPLKYYFEDVGLRNARLNFRQHEENYLMENIIYNELRARGFSVDVGVVEKFERNSEGKSVRKNFEIDFVATLGSRKYYVQSAFTLSGDEKEKQEKQSLLNISDSFKKIIVVRDYTGVYRDENGIVTIGILDFLLNENSLDL
ncbi:MAG TPA: ATP-binding protein [Methanocorpusculum sp.]|nr:ATP-binding protein [Methanocorpusculum sp.]